MANDPNRFVHLNEANLATLTAAILTAGALARWHEPVRDIGAVMSMFEDVFERVEALMHRPAP